MYSLQFNKNLRKKLNKLSIKDKERYSIVMKKIQEIVLNPSNYKKLRGKMFGLCRVHIDKSFVLTFRINESEETVFIEDFDHHDKIYK